VTAEALVEANVGLWQRITSHPFVVAAADGTLPVEAFDRWLVEDHHFVVGFRRFLAGLVALAPDEPARDLLAGGLVPLQAELDLFRREAAARGLALAAEPSPTTLGYTSFLVASLADGFPVAVTVLYGAERAYLDAWCSVRAGAEAGRSPYWPFIDNWSSAAFGQWVDGVAGLLDRTVAEHDGAARLAFERVVRFELRFWDAVHAGEGW
jgi:formylaminopyrimidine deformylase / aminopyrimidine aminohydrolase